MTHTIDCPNCNGHGEIAAPARSAFTDVAYYDCPDCAGTGEAPDEYEPAPHLIFDDLPAELLPF